MKFTRPEETRDVYVPSGLAVTLAYSLRSPGTSVALLGRWIGLGLTRTPTPPLGTAPPPEGSEVIGAGGTAVASGTALTVLAAPGPGSGDWPTALAAAIGLTPTVAVEMIRNVALAAKRADQRRRARTDIRGRPRANQPTDTGSPLQPIPRAPVPPASRSPTVGRARYAASIGVGTYLVRAEYPLVDLAPRRFFTDRIGRGGAGRLGRSAKVDPSRRGYRSPVQSRSTRTRVLRGDNNIWASIQTVPPT